MTAGPVHWLAGRRALLAGTGEALAVVGVALRAACANVACSMIGEGEEAGIAGDFDALEGAIGGGFDILVHAGVPATVSTTKPPEELDLAAWRSEISLDLDLRFLQSTEFARRCIRDGRAGAILFLLPSATRLPNRVAALTMAGAIENLVKSLAVEWARDGIRVNGIASKAYAMDESCAAAIRESYGHLAAYLVSDYGAYISGMVMGVDET